MVNSDKDFWNIFQQISNCGHAILDVENKALNPSLLSIFNRRNHAEFVAVLTEQIIDLKSLASDIHGRELSESKANALNRFILELISLATTLSTVCEGLHGKSLNKSYPHAQYMADVDSVRSKKASCNFAQTKLFE